MCVRSTEDRAAEHIAVFANKTDIVIAAKTVARISLHGTVLALEAAVAGANTVRAAFAVAVTNVRGAARALRRT